MTIAFAVIAKDVDGSSRVGERLLEAEWTLAMTSTFNHGTGRQGPPRPVSVTCRGS